MANGQGPGFRFNGFKGPGGQRSPLQKLLYWGTVLGVWGLIVIVIVFIGLAWDLPDTSNLNEVTRQPTISYLDRSGAVLAVRGSQYAPPVDLDRLPKYVPDAFIAIEDQHFYQHFGFNPWGIFRSLIYNATHHGGPLRGGSTITQQLARNLFLSADQNMRRKGQELLIAMILEARYSKKEILALYLNRVYFGHGAYGIDAAATRYFSKPARDLTLGEAAMLAGLVKGPSRYSPVSDQDRAKRRTELVLKTMLKSRKITREQYDEVFRSKVMVSRTLASQNAQYFVSYLDAKVRSLVGEPTENMVVETTLDLPIQLAAENSVRQIVARDAKSRGVEQAALVALDGEGRIRAYVGGADYGKSEYDRASLAERQAGSSFKPFVYLTAMDQGHTPYDPVVDEPVNIGGWEPKNYDGDYKGPMILQTALAKSINTVAAKLASDIGTGNVKATAQRLGITGQIQTAPSMALGAVEVTPIQMAQAYAPFSNGGFSAMGYGIERIRTASGRVLYDHSLRKPERRAVIGTPSLQYMNQMMRQVICCGTGTRARVAGYDIAGKTGTTSDYKDAWFVGYTGGFVAAVWVGKDSNKPMARGVTGGGPPAEIWRNFMAATLPRLRVLPIPGGAAPGAPQPPPPSNDPIGDLLNGANANPAQPPPVPAPNPQPAPAPSPAAPPSTIPY